MPLSFDPGAASNAPVPPLQPVAGVAVQPRPSGTTSSEQGSDDRVGDIVTGGTFDGLSLSYSTVTRTVSGTNTDKGSVAVTGHEAALDPHPQYHTAAEVAADIATHSAAADPHGDRAYADSADAAVAAAAAAALAATTLGDLADVDLTGATAGDALVFDGTEWLPVAGGGGGGVTDHGALTGLADDDHPQYHNDARGDARYLSLAGGSLSDNLTIQKEGAAALCTLQTATDTLSVPPLAYIRRSGGTLASPTNVKDTMSLGGFAAQGWDGSAWTTRRVSVEFFAAADWTPTSHPTKLALRTTSPGNTSLSTRFVITEDGEFAIGSAESVGSAGEVLTSGGPGVPPAWTALPIGPPWTYAVLGSDVVNSTTSTVTLTALESLPEAAGTYVVEGMLMYTSATTTSLPRFTVYAGVDQTAGRAETFQNTAANQYLNFGTGMTNTFTTAGSAASPAGTPMALTLRAITQSTGPTAAGNGIRIGFIAEIAGDAATIKAGSFVRWRKIA